MFTFKSISLFPFMSIILLSFVDHVLSQGNDKPNTHIDGIPLWNALLRILAAFGIGAAIGFERELTNVKRHLRGMAGMRTHGLIASGSCLIMLVSIYGFVEIVGHDNARDPSRLAAQAVSGVGFIGAGSILKGGSTILGLTSAASLWLVMAIGLGLGCGYWLPTVVASGACLVCMILLKAFERAIFGGSGLAPGLLCDITVVAVDKSKVTKDLVSNINQQLSVSKLQVQRRPQFQVPKQLESASDADLVSPRHFQDKEMGHLSVEKDLSHIHIAETTQVNSGNDRNFSYDYHNTGAMPRSQFPLHVSTVNTIEYKFECYLNHVGRTAFGKKVLAIAMEYAEEPDILVFKIGHIRQIEEAQTGKYLNEEHKNPNNRIFKEDEETSNKPYLDD